MTTIRSRQWTVILLISTLAIVLVATGWYRVLGADYAWGWLRSHLDTLQFQVNQQLLLSMVLFFCIYVVMAALSLPAAAVLSIAAGALFGRFLGTAVVIVAATLGASLAFLASRFLFRESLQQRFGPRLEAIDRGVSQQGAYYLLTLRLVPLFPFFLVNLGMGLTSIGLGTFAAVSLIGMLPGTFLYANAGTALASLDSPRDALSPTVVGSLALLGLVPLMLRYSQPWWSRLSFRTWVASTAILLLACVSALGVRYHYRYRLASTYQLDVREFGNDEYPEDPANRDAHHGAYRDRSLTLVQRDDTHFDFIFESPNPHVSKVTFKDIDVALMTPSLPASAKATHGLTRIALTDRQWNRQQARFDRGSPHLLVEGGDGFETRHLSSAALAKNCLNAGLWEVLLFVKPGDSDALYYQGWFTFPLGQYARLFERNTGLTYRDHWHYLEHWFDPVGTVCELDGLRTVLSEQEVPAVFDPREGIVADGEQARKRRNVLAKNLATWGDFFDGHSIRYATFIPPGRYSVQHPWKNQYWCLDRFEHAIWRTVSSSVNQEKFDELELAFSSTKVPGSYRFLVSGWTWERLPQLRSKDYSKGLYMPMGIGCPPFYQGYADLKEHPPHLSPYFSLLLDAENRWINHHDVAIDGPVLHRDADNPDRLHLYLLSYERESLIGHWIIDRPR